MTDIVNIPWVEKYRPTSFDNIVLDDVNQTILKNIIDMNYKNYLYLFLFLFYPI